MLKILFWCNQMMQEINGTNFTMFAVCVNSEFTFWQLYSCLMCIVTVVEKIDTYLAEQQPGDQQDDSKNIKPTVLQGV